jgi:hypothetical protein
VLHHLSGSFICNDLYSFMSTPKMNAQRGRPPGREQDRIIQMRVSHDFLKAVDEFCRSHPDRPSRSEAIRMIVMNYLKRRGNG